MSGTTLVIGRAEHIEELVRADAERRGQRIVPGTLKVSVDTIRRSKAGEAEVLGPQFRYEYEAIEDVQA